MGISLSTCQLAPYFVPNSIYCLSHLHHVLSHPFVDYLIQSWYSPFVDAIIFSPYTSTPFSTPFSIQIYLSTISSMISVLNVLFCALNNGDFSLDKCIYLSFRNVFCRYQAPLKSARKSMPGIIPRNIHFR